jgi:ribosomal protein S18 acetylase RimI-like enzyme
MVEVQKPGVREARAVDAAALAQLAEQTFQETFAPENTATDMDAYCATHFGETSQRAELCDPSSKTFVAEVDGQLIGYAQIRWSAAPPCVVSKNPFELRRLYVRATCHGLGVAQDLMRRCLGDLVQQGADFVWLGVWERNPRAIRFYEKFDFRVVGEQQFRHGTDVQRDLILSRSLRNVASDQSE